MIDVNGPQAQYDAEERCLKIARTAAKYECAHLQTRVDVLFLPKIKIKRDKNLAHLCESDIIALIR